MNVDRPRILVLADHYLPGSRAGGPIRSIVNMTDALGDRFDFRIITRDRDLLASEPYTGILTDSWISLGQAQVFYLRPQDLRLRKVVEVIRDSEPDAVFANSLFSFLTLRVLVARWLRRLRHIPMLVAPRGELGKGALSIKPFPKRVFLVAGRLMGVFSGVVWQGSSLEESNQIESHLKTMRVVIASDIPVAPPTTPPEPASKSSGSVRFVFIGRIVPIKNLIFFLGLLPKLVGDVSLGVFGPADAAEWQLVQDLLKSMPGSIRVEYHGAVTPDEIPEVLQSAHFSILPTKGENFGHSVYEALRLGRPVVISDRTPWQGLATANAGWAIPLESREMWASTLQRCIDLGGEEHGKMSVGAHEYARSWFKTTDPDGRQAVIFEALLRD